MTQQINVGNAMGLNGGEPIHGTGVVVKPLTGNPNQFNAIKAINGALSITAITCNIDYSSLLPISLDKGDTLFCPGCSTLTATGDGVAFYA